MLQAVQFNQHLCERMIHSQDPDTPSGLISPPPGCQVEVKDEPVDEDAPEPPEIVLGEEDSEDSEDEDIHDNDESIREFIANQEEVRLLLCQWGRVKGALKCCDVLYRVEQKKPC